MEERETVAEIAREREKGEQERDRDGDVADSRLLCLKLTGSAWRMALPFAAATGTATALLTATKC